LFIKSLKVLFSGVWESRAYGFSVGGEVAKANAAKEVDMEDLVEVESDEVVEVEAGTAVDARVSVQAGVAVEVGKVAAEAAG
jgi:hypothetical protein